MTWQPVLYRGWSMRDVSRYLNRRPQTIHESGLGMVIPYQHVGPIRLYLPEGVELWKQILDHRDQLIEEGVLSSKANLIDGEHLDPFQNALRELYLLASRLGYEYSEPR